ncbi:hypothetical protein [Arcicella rosea]|uniref:Uncharacterized protein n=1 Tax=Arcicella rosea TaxID=502909 RepID=A0A841EI18_9BACT|nr:hypothetical protein [Arcicella rosea]MBB6003847.1 hypothetical protein [Arcicella rosea]
MAYTKRKVALIDISGKVGFTRLTEIASAIQIQMQRDVAPHWGIEADVVAFRYESEVPSDFWITSVVDSISERTGINGYHSFTGSGNNRRAYCKVIYRNWTDFDFTQSRFEKVVSEETIEMCINPFLENRLVGKDPEFADRTATFLVELGDPGNRLDIGYYINDVFVTDFIYPSYYNAIHVEGTKYDHLGLITKPYSIVDGGYQIFQRAGQWYNALKIKGKMYFIKQGEDIPQEASEDITSTFLMWFFGVFILVFFLIILLRNIFKSKY